MSNVVAAILAAGEASRLGRPKQLLQHRGMTLLERLIRELDACAINETAVILGAHRSRLFPLLISRTIPFRINHEWPEGMASSIREAGDWAGSHPCKPSGLLLLAVDQPRVDRHSIKRLLLAFEGRPDRIVAARYRGVTGIPVLFGSDFLPQLSKLEGDRGARAVLDQFSGGVREIQMEEAGLDIDREADWKSFLDSFSDRMSK